MTRLDGLFLLMGYFGQYDPANGSIFAVFQADSEPFFLCF